MTKIMFNLAVTVIFAHRVTVNAGLLATICQSVAGVLSIVSHVFLHYRVISIPIIIVISPLFYDSSFIACAILFLLAQGCRNDIKKPSCLLSYDQYPPSTRLAGVSCGTEDNC